MMTEYVKGQYDMRAVCVALAERKAEGCALSPNSGDYEAAYRAMAVSMKEIPVGGRNNEVFPGSPV